MSTAAGRRPGTGWRQRWQQRWARHLVASLERRLETAACAHDGASLCRTCRLVTSVGFLPAAAAAPGSPADPR
ncbi:hypothetical protein [Modestobacter versicolor]|uniref:Uncharacterized protein n=1 Tax=Modestobacter versicolor TaxID=429133 RepID=A0A323VB90_9ACTN|nr:hypothetical protein [Modestobacter versicolor]MBB3674760.1 hypothetical protein [Modestobacter versicolor]PZA22152.1 hypothetical protein DMO24_06635 [Modestobacter versicolor]